MNPDSTNHSSARNRFERGSDYSEISAKIAANMKAWRKEKGFSEAYMAEQIGVAPSSIHRYETSPLKIPAFVVQRYCEILDIPVDRIIQVRDTNVSPKLEETGIPDI